MDLNVMLELENGTEEMLSLVNKFKKIDGLSMLDTNLIVLLEKSLNMTKMSLQISKNLLDK